MSQLVRLEGKHSSQNAHCALQRLAELKNDSFESQNIVSCPKVEPTTNLTEVSKQLDSCHNLVPASVRI